MELNLIATCLADSSTTLDYETAWEITGGNIRILGQFLVIILFFSIIKHWFLKT